MSWVEVRILVVFLLSLGMRIGIILGLSVAIYRWFKNERNGGIS